MQRRHFELIAGILRNRMNQANSAPQMAWRKPAIEEIARDFADQLARTNELFDRERFLKACGLEE